jgi:ATP-binding protein involved in chromosome partitioning
MSDSGCNSCSSGASCDSKSQCAQGEDKLAKTLNRIKHKIVVLSGKGGVGKSTVSVNIAVALALAGKKVGLLDVDVHGPSIPRLLSLQGSQPHMGEDFMEPVPWPYSPNLSVISLGFMLPSPEQAVIWRGPVKIGLIKQFVQDVCWGDLDFLVVDCPPGTGDEPLSALQTLGPEAMAVIVTTPQGVAVDDVRRSVSFCREVGNPVLGIVENMSGYACPHCGKVENIFNAGGGEALATEMGVPFLGRIPLDPEMVRAGDEGYVFIKVRHDSPTAEAVGRVVKPLLELSGSLQEHRTTANLASGNGISRIAIPVADGKLCMHFGHCQQFALVDIDPEAKAIKETRLLTPPPHEPGVFPKWLAEQGANLIIAGGMGSRAQSLFTEQGVAVLVGATPGSPEEVVKEYLAGTLQTGANICDH